MVHKKYILMLESDSQDRELSSAYFESHGISFEFLTYSNEVIPFLQNKQKTDSLPSILLVTMNSLPDIGITVLKEIKTLDAFKHIPVIVLGENTQTELIKECYANGASTFINKPFTNALTDISIKSFITYWFEVAQLPEESSAYSNLNI